MDLFNQIHQPSNWSYFSDEVKEFELSSYTSEYNNVKSKLTGRPLDNLRSISRIECPYLYKRYMLRKLEYEYLGIAFSEIDLLHATDKNKIPSIIADNLDWRKANRVKFGRGVSFSPDAAYANRECARSNGCYRAIVVCKVLVGPKYPGSSCTSVPPPGYDTTYGNGDSVYVKYYDDEFYPTHVAYYTL